MFGIEEKSENGFNQIILKSSDGCFAAITPQSGGMLHAFGVERKGGRLNVIDHYESARQFREQAESLGHKSCKLSPYVCRMKDGEYTFGQNKYTIKNGYGPHALHGLIYRKSFSIISTEASDTEASLIIQYNYDKEDPGFPFSYSLMVSYTLLSDFRLRICTTVINHSEGLMPIQDGWHPYFSLGTSIDNLELEFQALNRIVFNDDLLPTGDKIKDETFGSLVRIGNTRLDNCYELDMQECQPLCVLRNASGGLEVQFFPDKSYPFLQIYTPEHRQSIAIENISGPPNGFNLDWGHRVLERGAKAEFKTTYKIHFLK